MGARIGGLCAILAASCSGGTTVFVPLPPDVASARSMLVTEGYGSDIRSVSAVDLGAEGPRTGLELPSASPAGEALEITAILYAESLPALRFEAGPLRFPSANEAWRMVPTSTRAWSARVTDGEASDWRNLALLPDAVRAIRLFDPAPPRSPCVTFEQTRIPLTTGDQAFFAVAVERDLALVATLDGHFHAVSSAGAVPLTALSTDTPHAAGFRASDGEVWLIGTDGRMMRGHPHPDRGFVPVAGAAASGAWKRLVGASEGSPFELFLVTDGKAFERFDGASWTTLDQSAGPLEPAHGSVAWVRSGEAFAVGPRPHAVLTYRDGQLFEEPFRDPNVTDEVSVAAFVPGVGRVVGTSVGVLHILTGRGWEAHPTRPLHGLTFIEPLDQGLIAGGSDGAFVQYYSGYGYCPAVFTSTTLIRRAIPFGDGFLLVPRTDDGAPEVILLTRER